MIRNRGRTIRTEKKTRSHKFLPPSWDSAEVKLNYTKQGLNYYLPIRLRLKDFDKNKYIITAELTMFMTFASATIKNNHSKNHLSNNYKKYKIAQEKI